MLQQLACSLERGEDGSMQVQKIQCARVYHINVVLRIRTSLQDTRKDQAYKEKSLQIQRSIPTLQHCYCLRAELPMSPWTGHWMSMTCMLKVHSSLCGHAVLSQVLHCPPAPSGTLVPKPLLTHTTLQSLDKLSMPYFKYGGN